MQLSHKQLIHLSVETESGTRLGSIVEVVLDSEQHVVVRYVVRSGPLPRPLAAELLVAPAQVVSLSNEKMVVEDNLAPSVLAAVAPTPTV